MPISIAIDILRLRRNNEKLFMFIALLVDLS